MCAGDEADLLVMSRSLDAIGERMTSRDEPSESGGQSTPRSALHGVRVVEICSGVAGPYAGKLLRDLGADVLRIEPPSGDPLRTRPPVYGSDGQTLSTMFEYLNGGKGGVCLDLTVDEERGITRRLLRDTHLVLEDVDAEIASVGDLMPDSALARGRALVLLSDFGDRGPYAGRPMTDLTMQASAGWVSPRGQNGVAPVQVGLGAHNFVVGAQMACAALTALRASRRSGEMVTAHVSRMEAVFNTVSYDMLRRETLLELGYPHSWPSYIPGLLRCRDGWVAVNCLTGQHWQDMCAVLDVMEYADSYVEMRFSGAGLDDFYRRIQPWFSDRDGSDILETLQAFRVPAAPVGDGETMPAFDQYKEREFFGESSSGITMPTSPLRLSATPTRSPEAAPTRAAIRETADRLLAGGPL